MSKNHLRERNAAICAMLAELYPSTFMPPGAPKKPLAIGIGDALTLAIPEVGAMNMARALNDYTGGPIYLRACVAGADRIGLDGKPNGVVTEAQAAHAAERLAGIEFHIEKRRAKGDARAEAAE